MFLQGTPNIERLRTRRDVAGLVKALRDRQADVRCAAAVALGELKAIEASSDLVAALNDESERVRQAAATALAATADPDLAERLSPALASPDEFVQHAAALALARHFERERHDKLLGRLRDSRPRVREAAAEALGHRLDLLAVPALIDLLRDPIWSVSDAAARALLRIGAPAVEPLCATLAGRDPVLRRQGVYVLGQMAAQLAHARRQAVTTALIPLLGDERSSVRANAAQALGRTGGESALWPLIAALGDERAEVREAAAGALGPLRDGRAVPPLVEALRDETLVVRASAARALAQIGAAAVPPLMAELLGPDPDARCQAAMALGELAANLEDSSLRARTLEALRACLRDSSDCVRLAAARALAPWGPGADPELQACFALAAQDWDRLVRLGLAAAEPLLVLYRDSTAEPRRRAGAGAHLAALANLPGAELPLRVRIVETLASPLLDDKDVLREAAADALVRVLTSGQDTALQARILEHFARLLASDAAGRAIAVRALAQSRLPEVVEPIIGALSDPVRGVRQAAGEALARLYWHGSLDDRTRQRILAQRESLSRIHTDHAEASGHVDTGGIGVTL